MLWLQLISWPLLMPLSRGFWFPMSSCPGEPCFCHPPLLASLSLSNFLYLKPLTHTCRSRASNKRLFFQIVVTFWLSFKIVGNLLYYRYMNPAIVAPDAFDIIDMSAGGQLTTEQRRNLGSIAKMLQHAASNKMFLGDNAHLNPINEYLSNSYQKFRYKWFWKPCGVCFITYSFLNTRINSVATRILYLSRRRFFLAACDVPSLEDKFNVDQYSDLVTLTKPVIYISIGEMINTHTVTIWNSCYFHKIITPNAKVLKTMCVVFSSYWIIRMPLHPTTMIPSMSCWMILARCPA